MILTITMPSHDGEVEAVRSKPDEWEINYPWFSERYSGSPTDVRAQIKRVVKKMKQAEKET